MTPSLRASDPGSKRTKTAGASSLMLATADTEDVAVRMADVHLPHAPWLVGRRPGHLEALREAPLVDGVHVVHPDRHPAALVRGIVAVGSSRFRERAPPPASLRVQAEEDLEPSGADAAESRRVAPVPPLLPAELLEPHEALLDVGDVQDRSQALCEHCRIL